MNALDTFNVNFEYKNKVYQRVEDTKGNCFGCAFQKDNSSCGDINQLSLTSCANNNSKFMLIKDVNNKDKEADKKFTVKEVLAAFYNHSEDDTASWFLEAIEGTQEKLKQRADPEYVQYLKLKEKYED